MVGITGHGKSRLGSYLFSPENTLECTNVAFDFAEDAKALTQTITPKPLSYKGIQYEIVDTPGFG